MDTAKIAKAAKMLADAWRDKYQIKEFPADLRPANRADAYAIQDEMARLLGYEVIGWKLGMTAPAGLKASNMDGPIPGRMFKVHFAEGPATMKRSDFINPVMEPEFAFRLTADITPREEPYTREFLAAVAVLHLAIEVAGQRFVPPQFDGMMMIADDGGNAAFVAGPQVPGWQNMDLPGIASELYFDGELAAETLTGDARCDPLWVLEWLANDLSARGITLPSGSWVSTGSGTKQMPLGDHKETIASFAGLGKVALTLV